MTTRLLDDESGDLRTGFFFRLHTNSWNPTGYDHLVYPSIHADNELDSYMEGDPLEIESEVVSICDAIPGHSREIRLATRINLELSSTGPLYFDETLRQFVATRSYHVVNVGLARSLRMLPLRGLRVLPCEEDIDAETGAPRPMFFIRGSATAPFKSRVIDPPSLNLCPWCLRAPAICGACDERFTRCIRCDRLIFCLPMDEHHGRNDPRIEIEPPSIEDQILDVGRWNGDDILGDSGAVITLRLYQQLLGLGARSFAVTPVRADVSGITEEKWQLLEDAVNVKGFRGYPWPLGSSRPNPSNPALAHAMDG